MGHRTTALAALMLAALPGQAGADDNVRSAQAEIAALEARADKDLAAWDRLASLYASLGSWTRLTETLPRALDAARAASDRRRELQLALRLGDAWVSHSLTPTKGRAAYLKAAQLADALGDAEARREADEGLDTWAARVAVSVDLLPIYRGALDSWPFHDELDEDGGSLRVGPDDALYLDRGSLARFDGTFLEDITPVDAAGKRVPWLGEIDFLPDGRLVAGARGAIWVRATDGGWTKRPLEGFEGVLAAGPDGHLWLGLGPQIQLAPLSGGAPIRTHRLPPSDGGPSRAVSFAPTEDGGVFVVSPSSVERLGPQGEVRHALRVGEDTPNDVRRVIPEPDGTYWLVSTYGAYRYQGTTRIDSFSPAAITRNPTVRSLLRASDGAVWMGLGRGVARRTDDGQVGVLLEDGDHFEQVYGIAEWRGEVWYMNRLGQPVRVRQPRITTWDRRLLPSGWIYRVHPRADGSLQLATGAGAARFWPETLHGLHYDDAAHCAEVFPQLLYLDEGTWLGGGHVGHCVTLRTPGETRTWRKGGALPFEGPEATVVYGGRPCVGHWTGVHCLEGERWVRPPELAALEGKKVFRYGLVVDPEGHLLVSVIDEGVYRAPHPKAPGGQAVPIGRDLLEPPVVLVDAGEGEILLGGPNTMRRLEGTSLVELPGLPEGGVQDLHASARRISNGRLLLSVLNVGLMISDGEDWTILDQSHGLASLHVEHIVERGRVAEGGEVWLGMGGAGLSRVRWDPSAPPETFVVAGGVARYVDPSGQPRQRAVYGSPPESGPHYASAAGLFGPPEAPTQLPVLTQPRLAVELRALTPRRSLGPEDHLFRYRVDGGPWRSLRGETRLELGGLSNGAHTLEVRAKGDLLTPDPTPVVLAFTVATPLPVWVWPAAGGGFVLLLLWQRRRLTWLYERWRYRSYTPIPDPLFPRGALLPADLPLFGREDLLSEALSELLATRTQGASVLVDGPVGAGKSTLLRRLAARLERSHEARIVVTLDLVDQLPEATVSGLLSQLEEALGRRAPGLTSTDAGVAPSPIVGSGLYTDVGVHIRESPYRRFDTWMDELVRELDGRPLHLLVDGAQRLADITEDDRTYGGHLLAYLRELLGRTPHLSMAFALDGSRRELQRTLGPLYEMSAAHALVPLDEVAAADALRTLAGQHLRLHDQALELLVDASGGRCELLMALGARTADLCREARTQICTPERAALALEQLVDDEDDALGRWWGRLDKRARLVLAGVAASEGGVHVDALSVTLTERKAPLLVQEIRREVDALTRRGLLAASAGRVRLRATLLARWVRGHQPLDRVIQTAQSVIGAYQVLERVGAGGMGTVYKARHLGTQQVVALKVMRDPLATDDRGRRRFKRESQVGMALRHPSLIRFFEFGEFEGRAFIAMEFLSGVTLSNALFRGLRLSWDQALELVLEVARGLDVVHRAGVVHRDVKSENIFMVARDPARAGDEAFDPDEAAPGELRPILMDFGLAHSQAFSTLTESGMMIGTVPYMSPEQAAGEQELTPASDVYSLGVVLYEALTGERPIVADTSIAILRRIVDGQWELPSRKVESIPVSVDSLIQHMMSLRVIDRPQNAGEVAQLIEDLLAARDAG